MKRWLIVLTVGIGGTGFPAVRAAADPKMPPREQRYSMGNRPSVAQPSSGRSVVRAHHGSGGHHSSHYYHPRHHGAHRHFPYSPYGYGYRYYRYPYSYPYYHGPYRGYYYPGPVFLPAETLYGPEAVKRFMGVDHWFRPGSNVNVIVTPNQGNRPVENAAEPQQLPRPAPNQPAPNQPAPNQRVTLLAWKFIGFGDAHFGNQQYADANERYQKAAGIAPQLADAWFRQAFALVAMGRHELAVRAIKRGLELEPNWATSDFRLGELFGGNGPAKTAHVETLAKASDKNPNDADLLFLLGVHLHFDGKPQRAVPFFQRAKQLLGGDDAHLKRFL